MNAENKIIHNRNNNNNLLFFNQPHDGGVSSPFTPFIW